jgi:GntR family transcriptional regulator/MocR family aminotransferase
MQIPILLDPSGTEMLTAQLARQLRAAIRQGQLPPGTRLTSSRRLSEQLDVSRNTVIRAYDNLLVEGYLEARPASGIFVARQLPEDAHLPPVSPGGDHADATAENLPMPHTVPQAQALVAQTESRISFDFFPGRPSAGLFPLKTWRRLAQGCLSHGGAIGLSQYGDPAGLITLRSAVARHLAAVRGIVADPSRIVIVNGIQEGLNIVARLFLSPGKVAALEEPCYQGAMFSFAATGADLVHVPVDQQGLKVEALPESPTALLYLTPSHQYPTGHTMSLERRRHVISWARRQGCYLLEDDYDSDFRYEGSPLPAVAAIGQDCTFYLGTFSKSLGAGLRLGYVVPPPHLVDAVRASKTLLNNGNPWLDQAVLAELIGSGSYAAHLARIRVHYRENRDCLLTSLHRHFGEVEVSGQQGGLHLLWRLPPGVPDAVELEALARRVRVGIYSLASGGAYEARRSPIGRRGIVLGYACLSTKQIEQGVARLSNAVDEALERHPNLAEEWLAASSLSSPDRMPTQPAPSIRQRPALYALAPRRALYRRGTTTEDGAVTLVAGIFRYPIKGLSAQAVPGVTLEAGKPFPFDRIFALARPGGPIDSDEPKWAKKGLFVMLMLDDALAQVQTFLDVDTLNFSVRKENQEILRVNLGEQSGRAEVEQLILRLVPTLRAPPRLVRARDGHFMDKPDNVLSLINLATVRHLQEQWGFEIDPLRFRANFYIDGAGPWEEFDWIGSDLRLGDALFRVDRRNGRCGATNVNPATGRRDLDIPASLRAAFGHKDLGVYLVTRKGGKIVVGDPAHVPRTEHAEPVAIAAAPPVDGQRRFICRGCYFIYEEGLGLPRDKIPAGTPFASLAPDWRCPDCGTDKMTFRPYVPIGVNPGAPGARL